MSTILGKLGFEKDCGKLNRIFAKLQETEANYNKYQEMSTILGKLGFEKDCGKLLQSSESWVKL